jgi:hypothetical protein
MPEFRSQARDCHGPVVNQVITRKVALGAFAAIELAGA